MLGARLARRIVLPILGLIGVLFVLLAVAAVSIAEGRVAGELEARADRVAAALEGLRPSVQGPEGLGRPAYPPEIIAALERLVAVRIVVEPGAGPTPPGTRALERRLREDGERCLVLFDEEEIARRRRDVLAPVATAGALGLLVALVLGLAVARTIARPVRRLADSVKGFAQGRFDGAIGERGPGEIGELQEAFLRMVLAIHESEERLKESERFAVLGRLAGGIAHELRNPLTAIRMAVEMAAAGDEEARAEARRVALAEIERLDRTLRELLDYVRPRKLRLGPVALGALFEDVRTLLKPQCDHLRVKMEVERPEATVRADYDRLKQALLNLVLNAAQAQPEGGVVRLRFRDGAIEVEDEGAGIPEDVRESLFQPFVTTRAAGIGIGLAVVKQVAAEHGAEVDFETGRGGTVFRLRFAR